MITAQIMTPWTGTGGYTEEGLSDSNRPLLGDEYQLVKWEDVTGQHRGELPEPNLYVVQVVCTPEVLAAIEADDQYYVLWSEAL